VPGTRLHQLLAWEYRLRTFGWDELWRVLYYQPMFESLCRQVGPGCRLELCPESKLPVVGNVALELGARVRLSGRSTLSGARNAEPKSVIRIGDDTYLGTRANLRAGLSIELGKHVLVAGNALISSDPGHPLDAERRRKEAAPLEDLGRIVIEDDVWLGYNVSVLGTVRIGQGAVIGSGAVVVKDVPAYSLVVGNPARVVRRLDQKNELMAAPNPFAGAPEVRGEV
jgi:acetyltransferase-like isoleucine patch superfamily enzyme